LNPKNSPDAGEESESGCGISREAADAPGNKGKKTEKQQKDDCNRTKNKGGGRKSKLSAGINLMQSFSARNISKDRLTVRVSHVRLQLVAPSLIHVTLNSSSQSRQSVYLTKERLRP